MDQKNVTMLEQIDQFVWRIPKAYQNMRVDGLIFANSGLMEAIRSDGALQQVVNVACLPGIQGYSIGMPDIHLGYGFCIGGVCATDPDQGGVISPGGVGYDINCGVRLIRSKIPYQDVKDSLNELVHQLFNHIPTGVGHSSPYVFSHSQMRDIMAEGPNWLVKRQGLGGATDVHHIETRGQLPEANPEMVSKKAITRGSDQCGTLGGGNHFLELQVVEELFDSKVATALGLRQGDLAIMIHTGSRGLGHQVCTDYLGEFRGLPEKYGIKIRDRQLSCAPVYSPEGEAYLGAMNSAANFAWANRHLLMVETRKVFEKVLGTPWTTLGLYLVYDLAHNIAKLESHDINGRTQKLCVHRKGATRAFGPTHPDLPHEFRGVGQPVLIPGAMGRSSWVLVGRDKQPYNTFFSCCHGAGRRLSRRGAIKAATEKYGKKPAKLAAVIAEDLRQQGVIALARSKRELAEEQPEAYKDIDEVIEVVHGAGLARKVARLKSVGVIKG